MTPIPHVEKLIIYEPTMTALVAEDAHLTSAPTSPDHPLNINNTTGKKLLTQLYLATSDCDACSAGTSISIRNHMDHPTDDDDHHHERRSYQPVDLAALCNEITQTSAAFSHLLDSLAPFPLWINPLQPTPTTTTPVSTDSVDQRSIAVNNYQQPLTMIHSSTLPSHSLWTFLLYSKRYNNLQQACRNSSR